MVVTGFSKYSIGKKLMQYSIQVTLLGCIGLATAHAVPIEQGSLSNSNGGYANNSGSANGTSAATGAAVDSQGSNLWQLYQQVQQLQQEIRELRGELESQQNGLDRTQKEIKNRYTDLDQRIEALKEQTQAADDSATSADSGQTDSGQTDASTNSADSNNAEKTDAQPDSTDSNNPDLSAVKATNQSSAAASISVPPKNATPIVLNTEPDKQAYISAYDAYKVGGAIKAIKPMQQFIASFPNSVYVPNAYYWLGEFYLASNPADFLKAKRSFNEVVNKYPKSAKAATALYRVATITQEIDKRSNDAVLLMKKLLREYPSSSEAQYARSFIKTHA